MIYHNGEWNIHKCNQTECLEDYKICIMQSTVMDASIFSDKYYSDIYYFFLRSYKNDDDIMR